MEEISFTNDIDSKFMDNVSSFIDYCEYIDNNTDILFYDFEFDEFQVKTYKDFLLKKLYLYYDILKVSIKKQVKIEYKMYEMILDDIAIGNMTQMLISENPHLTNIQNLIYNFTYKDNILESNTAYINDEYSQYEN